MADTAAPADGETKAERRTWNVNPAVVAIIATGATLLLSLFILHWQAMARIDANRAELAGKIDSNRIVLRTSIEATRAELGNDIDAVNDRLDRILETLAGIGDVAEDIEALRADVSKLTE